MDLLILSLGLPVILAWILNRISYVWLKRRILQERVWDLNLCCGKTDGGGVNADIHKHDDVPSFVQIDNIAHLPFADGQFERVLCSHTVEHVDDPDALDRELRRVGREVVYVLPPLWDISAVLNVFEHQWVFLTLRKRHHCLPPRIRLPFSQHVQRTLGQRIAA